MRLTISQFEFTVGVGSAFEKHNDNRPTRIYDVSYLSNGLQHY
jgi:hypothetical protein